MKASANESSIRNIVREVVDHLGRPSATRTPVALVCLAALSLLAPPLFATENAPRKPFAEWADVPAHKQFIIRLWYQEAEAYHIWAGRSRRDITVEKDGEDYGIDRMQGVILMEYGITKRWAADLNVGYGTVGTRSFNPNGHSESTDGLLDVSFGVRYQLLNEAQSASRWTPTLTFRAGAVLPGSYDKDFPFAPGNHSAAIEPALLFKKHFGWPGFGLYGDALYRWQRTSGDDQYIVATGFFQDIQRWRLNVGYRHMQQLSGYNLDYKGLGQPLEYSPQVREISDAIDAGFSYTTSKRHWRWGFYMSKTLDGSNTDSAFWLGGYLEIPFGGQNPPLPP